MAPSERTPYPPIEDHGVVGDLHTVALVALDGTIDFLCFPHFDSPSVFASLLDHDRGGHFRVAPLLDAGRLRQLYLPDSNILLTRTLSEEGVAEVSDFMPVEETGVAHNLVRRAKAVRGEIPFRMECRPAFDYARAGHTVERDADGLLFISEGPDKTVLRLRSDVPVEIHGGAAVAELTLRAGETAAFVLEDGAAGPDTRCGSEDYVSESFKRTQNFWHAWMARSTYRGRWREPVSRSALVLKLMFSDPHGSIVASPTFGLPETVGGGRNWDYRYSWIRDSSFVLYALCRLGYTEEAGRYMRWLEQRCWEIEDGRALGVLYGLDGSTDLDEEELGHLAGYRGSRPVRIGNAAHDQLQLDIYGELMDAVYLYDKYGAPVSWGLWTRLTGLLDWLAENWRRPDEGIWETRGGPKEFLLSRVMCWVAFDRALRLAAKRGLPAPVARWEEIRGEIYRDVQEGFWSEDLGAYVQHRGSRSLDASALLMPLVRFVSPTDPRWLATLERMGERLLDDSLVYRYRTGEGRFHDGLHGQDGTFSMCTFWFVECLSRAGDLPQARLYFEKMLGYANPLGLYAEELGPEAQHLGNFPQAFTHMGLISAAFELDRRLDAGGGRGSRPSPPADAP